MISVLLVDDHAQVLRNLRSLLETTDDMRVVGTAASGAEAIVKASFICPNVVVLDISMLLVDGIETAKKIHASCPSTGLMMLTIMAEPPYVIRCLEAGALGYVVKESIDQDLFPAIRAVSQGKRYFSHQVAPLAEQFFHQRGEDSGARE
jgi:DNA-binding NarL/FixJ family response regulator